MSAGDATATPQGVVAVLMHNGRELANAAEFGQGAPMGFRRLEFQKIQARRSLALAAISALASPVLTAAVDAYTAEKILATMCDRGCSVALIPVGYAEDEMRAS